MPRVIGWGSVLIVGVLLIGRGSPAEGEPRRGDGGACAVKDCPCSCHQVGEAAKDEPRLPAPPRELFADLRSEVEGQITIIAMLPEGAEVKEGDIVCELDSASLRDQLTNQEIAAKRAEADAKMATRWREVAEVAVKEFTEGTLVQQKAALEEEIALAEAELDLASDKLSKAKQDADRLAIKEAEVAALRARAARDRASRALDVLLKYTAPRETTRLEVEAERAAADQLARLVASDLEDKKEAKLLRQIEKCILRAPVSGRLVYANPKPANPKIQPAIEEGAVVRERQIIVRIAQEVK